MADAPSDFDTFNPFGGLSGAPIVTGGSKDFDIFAKPYVPPAPVAPQGGDFSAPGGSVDPSDLHGIIAHLESRGHSYSSGGGLTTSPKGAQGMMQVMPSTNRDPGFGVRPAQDGSEAERIRVGQDYADAMLKRYNGNVPQALAAYNAGPGRVDQALKQGDNWFAHLPAETRQYVNGGLKLAGGNRLPEPPPTSRFDDAAGGFSTPSASDSQGGFGAATTQGGFQPSAPKSADQGGFFGNTGALSGLQSGIASAVKAFGSAADFFSASGEAGASMGEVVIPKEHPDRINHEVSQALAPTVTGMEQRAAKNAPKNPNLAQRVVGGAAGMVPAMAAGAANPLAMAGIFAQQSYDETYKEAMDHGLSRDDAQKAAAEAATISGTLGMIPGEAVVSKIGGAVAKKLGIEGAQGAVGQIIQRGVTRAAGNAGVMGGMKAGSNIVARENYDPNRGVMEGVGEAALEGALAGELIHGTMRGVGKTADVVGDSIRARQEATDAHTADGAAEPMPATDALHNYRAGLETPETAMPEATAAAAAEPIKATFEVGDRVRAGDTVGEITGLTKSGKSARVEGVDKPVLLSKLKHDTYIDPETGRPVALHGAEDAMMAGEAAAVPETGMMAHEAAQPADTREPTAAQPLDIAALQKDAQATHEELTQRLVDTGLDQNVSLRIVDSLNGPQGSYHEGVIKIALDHPDTLDTMNHEVLHAVKDAITPQEWDALTRAAKADPDLMASVERRYPAESDDPNVRTYTPEEQHEEAVADMFKAFARGERQPKGAIATAFDRVRDIFRALGNVLRGRGYTTADMAMRAIDQGRIGGRMTEGRYTASPLLKAGEQSLSDAIREVAPHMDHPEVFETPDKELYVRTPPGYVHDEKMIAALDEFGARPTNTYPRKGDRVLSKDEINALRRDGGHQGGSAAPLEGAPTPEGATGPDRSLNTTAHEYARSVGLDPKRQAEYVSVDPERAKRIADAYEAMEHNPHDPVVHEAYQNLIHQTTAQYRALEKAGYKFWLFDEHNDPYAGNPMNAMRDLRANKSMGVFATEAGFGSKATDLDVSQNPMLAHTGIKWPFGSPDGPLKEVTANDLFRAVHDAFGHGIEGANFRARGEENAWQAHARLYTGSALGALTSETRGQNSTLNFSSKPLYKVMGEDFARRHYDEGYEGRSTGKHAGSSGGDVVSRREGVPSVSGVGQHDGSLQQSKVGELQGLRGEGDSGSSVNGDVSGVSGRDGGAPYGNAAGSDRQRRELRAGERPVDHPEGQPSQSTQGKDVDARRQDAEFGGVGRRGGDFNSHSESQAGRSAMAGRGGVDQAHLQDQTPLWKTITVGEHNRTAKTEDTIFADQKTGLMPEWTWREGRAGDMETTHGQAATERLGSPDRVRSVGGEGGDAGAGQAEPHERPPVQEDGSVKLDHWTAAPGLTRTDPAEWGKSGKFLPLEERSRRGVAPGRTYFGIASGEPGGYVIENFPGTKRERVEAKLPLDHLYDMAGDPDGLKAQGQALPRDAQGRYQYKGKWIDTVSLYENLIKDAGYKGYWIKDPSIGMTAAVYEPVDVSKPKFSQPENDLFADILRTAKERTAAAEELSKSGKSVRLIRDDGRYAIAGPDMSKPGTFRLTRFDEDGPVGHMEYSTLKEAVTEGLRERYSPDTKPRYSQPDEQRRAEGPVGRVITSILGRGADAVGAKLGRAANKALPDPATELLHEVQMGLSPMGAGSQRAQASAKDFANAQRLAAYQWGKVGEWITKNFDRDQRQKMWEAADEHGVMLRRGETPDIGQGLNRLNEKERAAVEELQRRADDSFEIAKSLGMVTGEGLESYVPRMIIRMTATGGPQLVTKDVAKPKDGKGGNLSTTTGQLRQRKHETVEETEAAAKAKFGEDVNVVRDIGTLALATQKLDQAIAGRTLVDKIKQVGKETGEALVLDGKPAEGEFFTVPNHPALQTWAPKLVKNEYGKWEPMVDQNGEMQFEAKPLYIAKEFEGPLKAVLTTPTSGITKALMNLKGKMMSVIMYSPLMHNAVIWGKAIPADPVGVMSLMSYVRGAAARKDPATMSEAIAAGMDPIGHRFFNQDIKGIAAGEGQNLMAGRSWTAQLISAIPGFFNKEAGIKTKEAIDKLGDFWHNTMLWDRIGDLQAGLYIHTRDDLIKKGVDPQTAQRYAAHFANRYAGALPMEGLSKAARTTANLVLFSRSFTLGNIAAYKDIMAGLPSDVRAQIMRDAGPRTLETVQGKARMKAMGMLVLDIGLAMVGVSLAAHMVSWLTGQTYQAPSDNEDDKKDKFLLHYEKGGTAVYGRLPTGKVAEDLVHWVESPIKTLKAKLSPYGRLAYAIASNDKGFGQKLYDPYDETPTGVAKNLGRVVWEFLSGIAPEGQLEAAKEMAEGTPNQKTAAMQAFLPLVGITVSKGAPGGPAMGDIYRLREEQQFLLNEARPEINAAIKRGDVAGAREKMTELGVAPSLQAYMIRVAQNPALRLNGKQIRNFMYAASPEEKAAFQADMQAAAARRSDQ